MVSDDQPDAREGQVGRRGVAERFAVPLKPGIDPEIVTDLFAYSRMQRTLQDIIGRPVDIARRGRTRPEMDAELTRDAVHAY